MTKKIDISKNNIFSIFFKILVGTIIFFLLIIGAYIFYLIVVEPIIESRIEKKFNLEFKQLSEVVKVERFVLWEGDAIVEITIKDKGKVHMYYDQNSVNINQIGDYYVDFQCLKKNKNGQHSYIFNMPFNIAKNSHLFSNEGYEVKNLKDVVNHYYDILTLVKTFPIKGEEINIQQGKSGTHRIMKNPDPKYSYKISTTETCYGYAEKQID